MCGCTGKCSGAYHDGVCQVFPRSCPLCFLRHGFFISFIYLINFFSSCSLVAPPSSPSTPPPPFPSTPPSWDRVSYWFRAILVGEACWPRGSGIQQALPIQCGVMKVCYHVQFFALFFFYLNIGFGMKPRSFQLRSPWPWFFSQRSPSVLFPHQKVLCTSPHIQVWHNSYKPRDRYWRPEKQGSQSLLLTATSVQKWQSRP